MSRAFRDILRGIGLVACSLFWELVDADSFLTDLTDWKVLTRRLWFVKNAILSVKVAGEAVSNAAAAAAAKPKM